MKKTQSLVVLGGCGGIGRCLIKKAFEAEYEVFALDLQQSIDRHPVPEAKNILAVDASCSESLEKAFSQIASGSGAINGFVNLCGFTADSLRVTETSDNLWQEVVDGNLNAAFRSAKAAIPHMQTGAAIVQVGSGLGSVARPGYGPYSVSKAGIAMLTKQLAVEYAPDIRVNCVAPGAVDTAFLRGGTGRSNEDHEMRINLSSYIDMIPLKRMAEAEDVAKAIMFFLSNESTYITGQTLHVNGGAYMP